METFHLQNDLKFSICLQAINTSILDPFRQCGGTEQSQIHLTTCMSN